MGRSSTLLEAGCRTFSTSGSRGVGVPSSKTVTGARDPSLGRVCPDVYSGFYVGCGHYRRRLWDFYFWDDSTRAGVF